MRKFKNKKGFTIVELVVVIAVIGVLTAILVPTFVTLSKRAQVANMQSFVTNINKKLAMDASTEGKNQTMHDAQLDAKEIGFDIEKITPFDGHDIIWDSESDRFLLVKDEEIVLKDNSTNLNTLTGAKKEKLFKVAKSKEELSDKYSNYLAENANWGAELANYKFVSGVDVGGNEGIPEITYERDYIQDSSDKDVIIRTNGGELNIDAQNDSVSHYGEGIVLNIDSVDTSSYHEFGYFPKATIKEGRFVIEEGAKIASLNVESNTENKTIYIQNKGEVNVINTKNSTENVEINNNGTIGVAVVDAEQQISGTTPNSSFNNVKTLTSADHDITEGGYYISDGSTLNKSSDTKYALNILTNEKVVVENLNIESNRGVGIMHDKASQYAVGAYDVTIINSTIAVASDGRGVQMWYGSIADAAASNITLIGSKFVCSAVTDYEVSVDSNSHGVMINYSKDLVINSDDCEFKGIGKSFIFNYYNGTGLSEHFTLNVKNTKMYARAGIDICGAGSNSVVNIENSKIHGINTFTGSTEGFGDIVLEAAGDGTTTLNIKNVDFEVYRAPGTFFNGQGALDIRHPATINFSGNNTLVGDIWYSSTGTVPQTSEEQVGAIILRHHSITVNGGFDYGICKHTKDEYVVQYEWTNISSPEVYYYGEGWETYVEFADLFASNYFMDNEHARLLKNIKLYSDLPASANLHENETVYIEFGNYTVTGGTITLSNGTTCITDKNVDGLFVNSSGVSITGNSIASGMFSYTAN